MSEIKPVQRFTCGNGGYAFCQGCYGMREDEDGHYVEFSAYEALQKQNKALKLMCESKTSQLEIAEKEVARLRSLDEDNKGLKECNSILTIENEDLQLRLDAKTLSHQLMLDRTLGLQKETAAQAKRIAELEDQLSSFPIPTAVAMQKIGKLRSEGFKEYAATVLNKENQYCIVGDYGDVRWSSKNGE